jgi:hypothetical protein
MLKSHLFGQFLEEHAEKAPHQGPGQIEPGLNGRQEEWRFKNNRKK